MTITVKYNDVAVSNAFEINVSQQINGKSIATFSLPSVLLEDYQTWSDRKYSEKIKIYSGSSLRFDGYVMRVTCTDSLRIECISALDELSWNYISEKAGKFIYDELKVQRTPADEYLDVLTLDGDDPGYSNDMLNAADKGYYCIISDNTLNENSYTYSAYSSSSTTGTTMSGSYSNTTDLDSSYWSVAFDAQNEYVYIDFSIANQPGTQIAKTSQITEIVLKIGGRFEEDSSITTAILRAIVSKDVSTEVKPIFSKSAAAGKNVSFYYEITIPVNESTDFFTEGATYFQDFGVKFVATSTSGTTISCHINLDYIECTLSYSTATFETINRKIRDTLYDAILGTELVLENDAESAGYDLSGKGINADDLVNISLPVETGFNQVNNTSIPVNFSGGNGINAGFYQDYNMITAFDLLIQICNRFKHIFYEKFDDDSVYAETNNEDDISAATVTYSASNDPPNLVNTIISENNEYGAVIVQYRNGVTPLVFPDTTITNPRTKLIQASEIVTLTEAVDFAKKAANYYASEHPSIELVWEYEPTNFPEIGTRYNVTLKELNGTISDKSFSDLICRRVIMSSPDANSINIRANFGGGNTPADEKIGMILARLERDGNIKKSLDTNRLNRTVVRHSDLLGILGSSAAKHVSDDTYTDISSDGSSIDLLQEVDMNSNKITNVTDPTADQDAATKKYVDDTNKPTWTDVADASLLNGWTNFDTTTYTQFGYTKIGNFVYMRGVVESSSGTSTKLYQLPTGYRPSKRTTLIGISYKSSAHTLTKINIYTDGSVYVNYPVYPNNWVSFDGLVFSLT